MAALDQDIDCHYGAADVSARILAALAAAGRDIDRLTRTDLAPFDEFHGGGLASTRDLARYAGLTPGLDILDVGCGIGGPARTLADEFGAAVLGVDLTQEFVRAARMLTARLGMEDRCRFELGNATTLPVAELAVDVVWSQNMLMNVADKARFFAEVARVLRPGGRFAFEAVLANDGRPLHLPTFWAAHAGLNHLVTMPELERLLESAGLTAVAQEDTTGAVIANGRKRRAVLVARDPAQLGIDVIVPADVELKMDNMLRNNEEGRTRTVKAVWRRPR